MKLVSVETPEKSVCKMTFSATAEELEAASNAVYERTRASYTIKGFAKGEADRAQIEADRGEHTFWYDAINDLMDRDVPALYEAAMAEHGFKAVDEPSYDLVSVKKDEGFVATATTPLQPELNLTQTTGFHVECVTPAVTDKEIDAVLERRRNAAAELVPHKGPAVKGNIVHIDYEGLLDGKPFQGGSAQNQTLQLGSGRMIPGFEDGILGHKGGEEFEINVTFPVRYHVKDLAYTIQTYGLVHTTPGKNAFLAATYCVFVPFFWWLIHKRRPDRYNLAAVLLCLGGMGLVSLQSDLRIGRGEGLTILSGVFYALHIIATASAARGRSPVLLSFVQFAVAAVLSWVTAPFAAPAPEEIPADVWLRLGYLCVMCTGLCFLLQTFGQKYTPPTTAALLLTLESVFGTLFSVAFYHEHLEPRVIVGFALILVAILISETKLKFLRRRMA